MAELVPLQRENDASRINRVLNDPAVRPWVADASEGVLDISPAVSKRENVLLLGEHGGCMFFKLLDGFYEVHTQVLPAGRGAWAARMIQSSFRWMFCRTDAIEILTRVPVAHRAAKMATLRSGAEYEWTRPKECRFQGKLDDVEIFSISLQRWVGQDDGLAEIGAWFHQRMQDEAKRLGIETPAHEDDPNHNRYVGAAYLMFRGGQAPKGTAFYNRWALISRHAPIQLLSLNPPGVRMDVGILTLKEDGDISIERQS
jgi:hypothetical protein